MPLITSDDFDQDWTEFEAAEGAARLSPRGPWVATEGTTPARSRCTSSASGLLHRSRRHGTAHHPPAPPPTVTDAAATFHRRQRGAGAPGRRRTPSARSGPSSSGSSGTYEEARLPVAHGQERRPTIRSPSVLDRSRSRTSSQSGAARRRSRTPTSSRAPSSACSVPYTRSSRSRTSRSSTWTRRRDGLHGLDQAPPGQRRELRAHEQAGDRHRLRLDPVRGLRLGDHPPGRRRRRRRRVLPGASWWPARAAPAPSGPHLTLSPHTDETVISRGLVGTKVRTIQPTPSSPTYATGTITAIRGPNLVVTFDASLVLRVPSQLRHDRRGERGRGVGETSGADPQRSRTPRAGVALGIPAAFLRR